MSLLRVHGLLLLAVMVTALVGCSGSEAMTPYEREIWQHRLDKDMMLRDASRTMLAPETRARFAGLNYFAVDEALRFEVPFIPLAEPETVYVGKRLGGMIPYRKVGYVEIPFAEGPFRLAAFHLENTPADRLWLAFRDETTGHESYGGGRYLETRLGPTVIVDFNLAYNPYCDYNPAEFNCAIPPRENRIPFAVRAGEKKSGLSNLQFAE